MTSPLFYILIGCLGLVTYFAISTYNGLVGLKAQLKRAWANIDVILKQRFNEIPQLIQIIEQFTQYEHSMIQTIMEARSHYGQSKTQEQKMQASQEISTALKAVVAIGEAYPELKSNQQFVQLQSRISDLENTLSDRRETYNDVVAIFNTKIEQFPAVFVARAMNFQQQEMFHVEEHEKVQPSLNMKLPNKKSA